MKPVGKQGTQITAGVVTAKVVGSITAAAGTQGTGAPAAGGGFNRLTVAVIV
jgi:hypothetical protein